MNLREYLPNDYKKQYYKINREEANRAAILYHLLLLQKIFDIFIQNLRKIKPDINDPDISEVEIYFEYALIRDIWKKLNDDKKRCFICEYINNYDIFESKFIKEIGPREFNEIFGVNDSKKKNEPVINNPTKWDLNKIYKDSNLKISKENFERLCKFKWSFNAKIDLVIHLSREEVIIIETKFESPESNYVIKDGKNKIIDVKQLELQEFLMVNILG